MVLVVGEGWVEVLESALGKQVILIPMLLGGGGSAAFKS